MFCRLGAGLINCRKVTRDMGTTSGAGVVLFVLSYHPSESLDQKPRLQISLKLLRMTMSPSCSRSSVREQVMAFTAFVPSGRRRDQSRGITINNALMHRASVHPDILLFARLPTLPRLPCSIGPWRRLINLNSRSHAKAAK